MIPVKNIYYMLSYAFQTLKDQGIRDSDVESFDNVQKLCAEILVRGVNTQIKRGLNRDYITNEEILSSIKGKINVSESIKTQSIVRRQLVCSYDDFSTDTKVNQIIKTTLQLLLRGDITSAQKKEIRKILVFFENVSSLDVYTIDWKLNYNRNNQTYQMLISICQLVIKGMLQTQSDGSVRLMDYVDEQRMSRLYEKFILEYYRREWKELTASAIQIPWQLDDGYDEMLPVMQTDITLENGEKTLIIDAKYYAHTMQTRFDKRTFHSGNLYQIFTYVKNKEAQFDEEQHEVAGMLLYAKTDEDVVPDNEYLMSGNRISVKTLDLGVDFDQIQKQLDQIATTFFKVERSI